MSPPPEDSDFKVCTLETRTALILYGWLPDMRGVIYHPVRQQTLDAFGSLKNKNLLFRTIALGVGKFGGGSWDDQWEVDCQFMLQCIGNNEWY